ncbi:MAG: serine/threonine-protein kinase [Myxococcota bacterium]|nr:serine/threonine-protein kinase [Myxococcota bacterium]
MNEPRYIGGYQLVTLIAEGGMGTIWKARHPHLDRWVAIKQIRADVRDDDAVQQAFIREVQNLSKLHSPQILRVLDFGFNESGEPYMVTEFLEGEDLSQRLIREHRLDLVDALYIGQEVLNALAEAHAVGLVHRDLKPGNIFLQRLAGERQDAVKVLDFGVAKLWESDRNVRMPLPSMGVKGSPHYMAPEQAMMGSVTPATDIYSFGATMYRMLTGVDVFVGEPAEVLRRQISEQPIPLRERAPIREFGAEIDDLVMVCLRKDPEERPASASALGKRLQTLLSAARASMQTNANPQLVHTSDDVGKSAQLPVWLESTGKTNPSGLDGAGYETMSDSIDLPIAGNSTLDGRGPGFDDMAPETLHLALDYSKTLEETRPLQHQTEQNVSLSESESAGLLTSNLKTGHLDSRSSLDPLAAQQRNPSRQSSQTVALMVAIIAAITVGIVIYTSKTQGFEAGQSAASMETDMSVRSVFEAIKSQTRADVGPPDDAPNIVKQLMAEKNVRRPSAMVLVTVAQGKSRFVRRKDGHVFCRDVDKCELPVDSAVVVYRHGFYPLKLEAMDLFDRRNNSWRVFLRKR